VKQEIQKLIEDIHPLTAKKTKCSCRELLREIIVHPVKRAPPH
jgi:hypothetical protein